MKRMTRRKDQFECRIDRCPAEDWLNDIGYVYEDASYCNACPFEKYINKLAEYEDDKERCSNIWHDIELREDNEDWKP